MKTEFPIEYDFKGRVIYRPGDGVGVNGRGLFGWLSETRIAPSTKLYHFLVIAGYIEREDDYVILESISRGTSIGRLSWYASRPYTIFRLNDPDYESLGRQAVEVASKFGRRKYDYLLYLKMAAWGLGYFLKEIVNLHWPPRLIRPDQIPYKGDRDFSCVELYFAVWNLVGRRIRAHGHAPVPAEVVLAVERGDLVAIDNHNGDPATWRQPRGPFPLYRAYLGRAFEDIKRNDLVALGEDGRVYRAVNLEDALFTDIEKMFNSKDEKGAE